MTNVLVRVVSLWRGIRSCCLVALIILLLAGAAACTVLGVGIGRAFAGPRAESGVDVMLVLDQSQSLYDLGGIGSDPDMLRMAGARLFATYLGVDGSAPDYRLGAVYFGSEAELALPLTTVMTPTDRGLVLSALTDAQSMGWTDVTAALDLAFSELLVSERSSSDHQSVLVIFTDGRPQTEAMGEPRAAEQYLERLRTRVHDFADHGTAFYAVLLRNEATDADPYIRSVYRPFWIDLAESGIGVRFFDARSGDDLTAIYHDIAVDVHRAQSQGTVMHRDVADTAEAEVMIPAGWSRASFVVRKSTPELAVSIVRPGGQPVRLGDRDVHYTGSAQDGRQEVWSVDRPVPGTWRLQVRGKGAVTVWLDYQPAAPSPTVSPSPSPSAMPSWTVTATPTLNSTRTLTPTPPPSATPTPRRSPAPMPIGTPTPAALLAARSAGLGSTAGNMHPRLVFLAALALLAGGSGILAWRQRKEPPLDGRLRLVQGPGTGRTWDLDRFNRPPVSIGSAADCDVRLADGAGVPRRAGTIAWRHDGGGDRLPVLVPAAGESRLSVDDCPVTREQPLVHGDVIGIGGVRLRYENVLRGQRSTGGRRVRQLLSRRHRG